MSTSRQLSNVRARWRRWPFALRYGIGALAFSASVLGLRAWAVSDDNVLDREGRTVSATVVDVSRFQRLPQVRLRFSTLAGRTVETNVAGDGDNLQPGDHVKVQYAERDPESYVRFAGQKDGPYRRAIGVLSLVAAVVGGGAVCVGIRQVRLRRD